MPSCPLCGSPRDSAESPCPRCDGPAPAQRRDAPALMAADDSGAPGALKVDVAPRLEYPLVPRESDPMVHVLVDVTPSGPPLLEAGSGPVAHVILALDLSASMNHPDKYPVLTEALTGMLYDLSKPGSAEVLLSVVLFAYGSEILFRDVPASTLDPREVLTRIDHSALRFGRYTDIVGAMRNSRHIAQDQLARQPSMPTRIYLLTDGKPQDIEGGRAQTAKLAKFPVDVDGLAFGDDADVALLQELVSGGRGGTVKHVRSETLADAFDRIAEVAQRVVTNRAIVEFELSSGVVGNTACRYRPGRHTFGQNAFADGSKFTTDLGTLEAGRTYSLLFEVRVPESAAAATEIGRFAVRVASQHGPRVFETTISLPRTASHDLPAPDVNVSAARDVVAALSGSDPSTQLKALRVRRKLYVAERRDPNVISVIDKAIAALEEEGTLVRLSDAERATLRAHTCTAGGARPASPRREFAAG